MRFFRRRHAVPAALAAATVPAERPLVVAPAADDVVLAASRFGLWIVEGEAVQRWDWPLVSKATLRDRHLSVTRADEIERWECADWPQGVQVLRDRPARTFALTDSSGLTDVVHHRVRRSVAASRQIPGLGWVVLRRRPGVDGVHPQVRLDPGLPEAQGLVDLSDDTVDLALRALAGLRDTPTRG